MLLQCFYFRLDLFILENLEYNYLHMEVTSICVKSLLSLKSSFKWHITVSFVLSKPKLWWKSLFCFPGYGIRGKLYRINDTQAELYPEANTHSRPLDSLRSRDALLWLLIESYFSFLVVIFSRMVLLVPCKTG